MNRTTNILLVIGLSFIVATFGSLLVGFLLGRWTVVPLSLLETGFDKNKYQLFVDLLVVLLAIVGAGIAAFGYGAYKLQSYNIQRTTLNATIDVLNKMDIRLTSERILERLSHVRFSLASASDVSYNKWFEWDITPEQDKKGRKLILLEMAINIAKRALIYAEDMQQETNKDFTKLRTQNDKEKKDIAETLEEIEKQRDAVLERRLILQNNLAYYLADYSDFATPEDKERARKLAQEVYNNVKNKDPAKADTEELSALETYCWVLKRLPRSREDVDESNRLISKILERTDIPQRDLDWYKSKYRLP